MRRILIYPSRSPALFPPFFPLFGPVAQPLPLLGDEFDLGDSLGENRAFDPLSILPTRILGLNLRILDHGLPDVIALVVVVHVPDNHALRHRGVLDLLVEGRVLVGHRFQELL